MRRTRGQEAGIAKNAVSYTIVVREAGITFLGEYVKLRAVRIHIEACLGRRTEDSRKDDMLAV